MRTTLPKPPARMLDSILPIFAPAPELKDWAFATFIYDGGSLYNPNHEHLQDADVLFLWSSSPFRKAGKDVVGTAQLGFQQGSLGKKELIEQRYREWNGNELPDFVITIVAPYVHEAAPTSVCALIEHELYHCAQDKDELGMPKFRQESGLPVWAIKGHDIEEFIGVIARYGAFSPELAAVRTVLNRGPIIDVEAANFACGCGALVNAKIE